MAPLLAQSHPHPLCLPGSLKRPRSLAWAPSPSPEIWQVAPGPPLQRTALRQGSFLLAWGGTINRKQHPTPSQK